MRIHSIEFRHDGTLSICCEAGSINISGDAYKNILHECSMALADALNKRPAFSSNVIFDETAKAYYAHEMICGSTEKDSPNA